MSDNLEVSAGDALFENFVEQIRQALEHLYDFAFLQQHALARIYDSESDLSAKTAGRKLRHALINAIETLKPVPDDHFRAPTARLYNILHLYYVENLTIQEVAGELGLSERQAYRDLKRGQESVASVLWNDRLPPASEQENPREEYSLESEVARLKLRFRSVDIRTIFSEAWNAVARLASQQSVDFVVEEQSIPLTLSTDPALAHQILVSILSYAIQQSQPTTLSAHFTSGAGFVKLALHYWAKDEANSTSISDSGIPKIAQRLLWTVTADNDPQTRECQVELHMASSSTRIMVIDDSDGWVELLERFLEGLNCQIIPSHGGQDSLTAAQELKPDAIILDVMMPEKDGWELLQRLRAQPATASTPIVVCSVFNDPQLAYSLGATVFVPKPANRGQILDALKLAGLIA